MDLDHVAAGLIAGGEELVALLFERAQGQNPGVDPVRWKDQ